MLTTISYQEHRAKYYNLTYEEQYLEVTLQIC